MGFQRNTQKPQENQHFLWFGAAREHASESFFNVFRCWAPCGRHLGALWRLWGALCRLWGPLWRLWVATWRPKARPGTPSTLVASAGEVRVTRFWSPRALGKQLNFEGQGPNALCHEQGRMLRAIGQMPYAMGRIPYAMSPGPWPMAHFRKQRAK